MTGFDTTIQSEMYAERVPAPFEDRIPPGRRRPELRGRFLDAVTVFENETRDLPMEEQVTLVAVTEAELQLLRTLLGVISVNVPVTPEQAILRQLPRVLADRARALDAGAVPADAVRAAPLQVEPERAWVAAMTDRGPDARAGA